jgi:thiamine biosynthesis protein ThiS
LITIWVNGVERTLPAQITLAELLQQLGVRAEGVAVAMNRQVVPRSQLAETRVEHGQQIEILRAVGGG